MKICFVGYSFAGPVAGFAVEGRRRVGGAEVFLYDQCKLLQSKGYETSVVQGGVKDESFDLDGIGVRQVKSSGRYDFNLRWRKAVPRDADHVHLHGADHAFPQASSRDTSTFHGVQWDLPYRDSGMSYPKWVARRRFFTHLAGWAVKHVREIVSVDTFLLRWVQSEMPDFRDKISVIPNYVDFKRFHPAKPGLRTAGAAAKGRKVILFPRNLTRVRGLRLIVEAFESLKRDDAELWVTGTGPELPFIERAAKRNPLIRYLGHKDHYSEMPAIYNSADVVVIPSLGVEGTSLSCLEAMACAKPVLAGRVGGLVDIIEEGTGILAKTTPADFDAHLTKLLDDADARARIGKSGLVRAREFSRERWAKSWLSFFDRISDSAK